MYRMLRQSALAVSRAGPRSGRVRSGQVVPAPSEVDGTGFEALSAKLCQLCVSHTNTVDSRSLSQEEPLRSDH